MSLRGIAVMPLSHKILLLKATFSQSKSLSSFWILNCPWAQAVARAVAPWHIFYSLDPQPLSFCPSVCQSISLPHQFCLQVTQNPISAAVSVLLMSGPQLKGSTGTLPCTEVLFWLFSLLEFLSPHLQLRTVPGWGGGRNTGNILLLNTSHYTTSLRQIVPDRMICTV